MRPKWTLLSALLVVPLTLASPLKAAAAPIELISPANGAAVETLAPKLEWSGQEKEYFIRVQAVIPGKDPMTEPKASRLVTGNSFTIPDTVLGTKATYEWQVISASGNERSPVWRFTTPAKENTTASIKARRTGKYFFQRAFEGELATKPGLLAITKDAGSDATYTIDFAAGYRGDLSKNSTLVTALEAKLGSTRNESDAWRFRLGPEFYTRSGESGTWVTSLTAKYEANQPFTVEDLLAELRITPVFPDLGIQADVPLNSDRTILFRATPALGLDVGSRLDGQVAAERKRMLLRLFANPGASLLFKLPKNGLGLNTATLFADYRYQYLALEDGRKGFGLFTTGVSFGFGEVVTLELSYKNGRDAPDFLKKDQFLIGLGFKY